MNFNGSDIVEIFEPRVSQQPMKTVAELGGWMTELQANKTSYGAGWRATEGFEIHKINGDWHWQYTERRENRTVELFNTEQEIVSYAYNQIRKDPWAWTHCIGFFRTKIESEKIEALLRKNAIPVYSDDIPYGGLKDPRFRVFVFGQDRKRAMELLKISKIPLYGFGNSFSRLYYFLKR